MTEPLPTIAVLASSPALTSILGATLRSGRDWRIREFRDTRALNAYMRIAPVAMVVCDYALGETNAADFADTLRNDTAIVSREVQIVAMSRTVDRDMRRRCVQSGIDEVIAKPMSPLYIEERVRARLVSGPRNHIAIENGYAGPDRRQRTPLADFRPIPEERRGCENVVSFLAHKAQRDQQASL